MNDTEHPDEKQKNRGPLLFLAFLLILLILIIILIIVAFLLQPSPPVADAGGPYDVGEGQSFPLDGSGSTGRSLDYAWDFGDGNTSTEKSPSHSYDDGPAQFTVTLVVTDNRGRTASDTTQATVINLPPTAEAGGPYSCVVGETITLSGTCGDPGPVDAASLTCTWAEFTGAAVIEPSYTCPPSPGEVTVTLTATDKDGASAQDSAVITVTGPPPSADANGPYSGLVNTAITFDGSGSTPADAIVEYRWDFGDGQTGMEAILPHTYTLTGTYTVNLTVVDANLQQDTDTTTATITAVLNELPVAVIDVTLILKTAQCYRFDGSDSFDPDGEIVTHEWDFGDGNTDVGDVVEYCYEESGTYTATLTVTDNQAGTGSASAEVVVPDLDP
jgi:PKD repeat protein